MSGRVPSRDADEVLAATAVDEMLREIGSSSVNAAATTAAAATVAAAVPVTIAVPAGAAAAAAVPATIEPRATECSEACDSCGSCGCALDRSPQLATSLQLAPPQRPSVRVSPPPNRRAMVWQLEPGGGSSCAEPFLDRLARSAAADEAIASGQVHAAAGAAIPPGTACAASSGGGGGGGGVIAHAPVSASRPKTAPPRTSGSSFTPGLSRMAEIYKFSNPSGGSGGGGGAASDPRVIAAACGDEALRLARSKSDATAAAGARAGDATAGAGAGGSASPTASLAQVLRRSQLSVSATLREVSTLQQQSSHEQRLHLAHMQRLQLRPGTVREREPRAAFWLGSDAPEHSARCGSAPSRSPLKAARGAPQLHRGGASSPQLLNVSQAPVHRSAPRIGQTQERQAELTPKRKPWLAEPVPLPVRVSSTSADRHGAGSVLAGSTGPAGFARGW